MRWRRDQAELDVANALPERSAAERAEIVRRCYRNLADTIVEAFWGFGASGDALKRRVRDGEPRGGEAVRRRGTIRRAVDGALRQLGVAAARGWRAFRHLRSTSCTSRSASASFDSFLREARSRFGSRLIPRKEFVYDLLSRAEQIRAYALIADQTPKHKGDPRALDAVPAPGHGVLRRRRQDREVPRCEGAVRADAPRAARSLLGPTRRDRRAAVRRRRRRGDRGALCPQARARRP